MGQCSHPRPVRGLGCSSGCCLHDDLHKSLALLQQQRSPLALQLARDAHIHADGRTAFALAMIDAAADDAAAAAIRSCNAVELATFETPSIPIHTAPLARTHEVLLTTDVT